MSELKDRLRSDLTASMKARDELRTSTLRLTLSALSNEEVAGAQARELADDEVLAVIRREQKKRREAAQAFADAGRSDSSERELAEAEVLSGYLPAELSDADLQTIVADAVADAAATGPHEMGAVMRLVQPRVAGRADGKRVATEVRRQLGS